MQASYVTCPIIDPVAFAEGPFVVSWYGLTWAAACLICYSIIRREIRHREGPIVPELLPELFFHGVVGAVIGARLGNVLIFNFDQFVARPWELFAFWQGGMSAFGAILGMVVTGLIFCRRHTASPLKIADATFLALPLGIMLIKIGNFINCESFGRITTIPWGVVFPTGGDLPRHPVQLYEAILEGPVLFLILSKISRKDLLPGDLAGFFLIGYGGFRFLTEFFREPDPHFGMVMGWLTMAQILSLALVATGVVGLVVLRLKRNRVGTSKVQD